MMIPAFLTEFVLGDVGELPSGDVGFRFAGGQTVDVDRVAAVAKALGINDDPVAGDAAMGSVWQVGPTDGSAPSLTVGADPQLSWWYSSAWQDVRITECLEVAVEPNDVPVEEPVEDAEASNAEAPSEPLEDSMRVDCAEPEPPTGVPSASEAESRAHDLLTAMGVNPDDFTLTTYADDWFAGVQADRPLPGFTAPEGFLSPVSFGFGFGAEGALQYANGAFAEPERVGPYPLVDLETAFARLTEPGSLWGGGFGGPAVDLAATDGMVVESGGDEALPVDGEMETRTVTLVDVVADLWWAWDDDGTMWLLPSYRFIGDDGGWYTVPAVTDEYLVVVPGVVAPGDTDGETAVGTDPDEGAPPVTDDPGGIAPGSEIPTELLEAVGSSLADFETLANDLGMSVRISTLDGEPQALTMDFNPQRVNVSVADDVVVGIDSLG